MFDFIMRFVKRLDITNINLFWIISNLYYILQFVINFQTKWTPNLQFQWQLSDWTNQQHTTFHNLHEISLIFQNPLTTIFQSAKIDQFCLN